ncbi:unnamed protein product [Closterium sp. NIES-54]
MATTALSTLPPGASSRALMTSGSSNLASKQSVQHLLLPQGARIARLALTAHASRPPARYRALPLRSRRFAVPLLLSSLPLHLSPSPPSTPPPARTSYPCRPHSARSPSTLRRPPSLLPCAQPYKLSFSDSPPAFPTNQRHCRVNVNRSDVSGGGGGGGGGASAGGGAGASPQGAGEVGRAAESAAAEGGRWRGGRRRGKTAAVGDGGWGVGAMGKAEAVGVRTNKLAWLADEGVMLDSERTLARVNRAIARCSSVREALGVVEEMKAKGLNAANEGTYQALITVCRRQRQGERALVVYAAMKQAGMAPGMLTFNALISCCHQAQRFEDAFRLKADMEAQGLKPDVVTYTSLMALVVKTAPYRGRSSPSQRFERAMELYREMRSPERAVQPDAITFNTLMFAAAQAKLPGKVLEVYGMMMADGVPPNQITFGILLEAVGSGGRLTAALQVFNEMRASGIPPTTSTFNYLIDACATAPRPDAVKAWSLFSEMEGAENVRPNAETFNLLITACTKAGDHDGALKAFGMMRERGYTRAITTSTFNKLIHSAAATPSASTETAFQLYSQMRAEGHRPDVVTLGTLITACGKDGDVARAMAVRQELEAEGVPPNAAVFHALMAVQGRAGLWPAALGTFREMQGRAAEWERKGSGSTVIGGPRENPLAPTLPAYTVLFDACFGPEGADPTIKSLVEKGHRLSLTPALAAAVEVYREAAEAGTFSHYALTDAYRCDVRSSTRPIATVALLSLLLHLASPAATAAAGTATPAAATASQDVASLAAAPAPAATVTAAAAGASADDSLMRDLVIVTGMSRAKAVGLKGKSMRALTMQALSVDAQQLAQWLKTDAAAVFPELSK